MPCAHERPANNLTRHAHFPEGVGISRDFRPTEEGPSDHLASSSFAYGDTNALYEGLLHGQGLVDRRSVPICFLGRELEAHFLH
jgi:hypothetical protein